MTGRATGLIVGALTSALLVSGCSGGSGEAAATSPSPAVTGTTGTSSPPASSPPAASPAGPALSAQRTTTPSLTPVPSKARRTLAPVAPSKTVAVGGIARTVLLGSRSVTVKGQGPGELSGPGLALTLQVTNGSSRPLDLDAVTVSAGVRGEEASSSDGAPANAFRGRLAAGAKAQGVYVFVLPAGARGPVGVVVSLAPDLPVARFIVP
jgi:hypothetical protein